MTEDAQSRMRGYGPFQEGTEPTAQIIAASSPSAPPPGPPTPATGASPVVPPPVTAQPTNPDASFPTPLPTHPGSDGGPSSAHLSGGGSFPAQPSGGDPYSAQPSSGIPYPAQPGGGGGPFSAEPTGGGPHPAQPSSGVPYPAQSSDSDPYSAQPTSGGPHPAPPGGYPDPAGAGPTSGAGYPAETGPLDSTGLPISGTPYDFTPAASYGPFRNTAASQPDWQNPAPTSGTPAPTSGTPAPISGTPAPISGTPAPTSGGAPDFAYTGRRIEPSPPPDRNRLIIGLLVGLVAGLLLFGTAGYFLGSSTHTTTAQSTKTPEPTPTTSLGIFEQNQVAQNQAHFTTPGLTPLAQGWLPYLSTCSRSGEPGGPVPNPGEKTRVRCTLRGMSVVFVEYASIADRDKARVKTLGQNVDARTLTPGVGAATQRPTPSARTTGNYVEYAYKLTEGRAVRTVAGIWWDDAQTPVAAYLLAYWKEGVSESWEPMRDLWSRYA